MAPSLMERRTCNCISYITFISHISSVPEMGQVETSIIIHTEAEANTSCCPQISDTPPSQSRSGPHVLLSSPLDVCQELKSSEAKLNTSSQTHFHCKRMPDLRVLRVPESRYESPVLHSAKCTVTQPDVCEAGRKQAVTTDLDSTCYKTAGPKWKLLKTESATLVESDESNASPILPFQRWADCITIRQPDSDKQQLPQSTDNESKAITHSQDTP
ncbi:hypothetical protein NQZ68_002111 [Dissostichus eleginoides]|nr:hypothetical protein NQZ68_002111 [Dissostichus eleginoides]